MPIMAGMLGGADSARRRRRRRQLRQADSAADQPAVGSRRSSSSSSLLSHNTTKESGTHRSAAARQVIRSDNYINGELHDWSLGSGAREAKERLDEKLRNQRASLITRRRYGMARILVALQRESKRTFSWRKLVWNKTAEAKPDDAAAAAAAAAECGVCLEEFGAGDELTHLPCAHRFHRSCAVPWLEISPNCPFCRTCVFSSLEEDEQRTSNVNGS